MKKIILSFVAIAMITLSSFGQAPEGFKYQAVVRDAGNVILNNQAVGMRMTIQQGSVGGTIVYSETFAPTTNAYGLVNLEIGNGTVTSGTFASIDWANGPFFIETAVDVTGGTNYVVMGTSQLMSVPYALYAQTSGSSTPGPQGPAGNDGLDGATGPMGPQGPAGNDGLDGATGPMGPQGPAGNDGLDGATGPMGPQGPAGNDGLDGVTGPMGPQGPAGNDGLDGATGPMGPQGPAGTNGATGPQGPMGPMGMGMMGPQGPAGATGATGATGLTGSGYGGTSNSPKTLGTGPGKSYNTQAGMAYIAGDRIRLVDQTTINNYVEGTIVSYAGNTIVANIDVAIGALGTAVNNWNISLAGIPGATGATGSISSEYGYIYNTASSFVTLGSAVPFSDNGLLSTNITHNPGSSFIFINVSGIYRVEFSATSLQECQFSIYQNGVSVAGSRYGSNPPTASGIQNSGQVIINVNAGDVIQLNNTGSTGSTNLTPNAGGTLTAVSASILITKLQ